MKYKNMDYDYITSSDVLIDFCEKISQQPHVALDTEFLREKTYWPELCLVQIKSGDHMACIDTLAIKDLAPLSQLLQNNNILKVLHSASQDLEIFYWLEKQSPYPLFDTQLAAPLLGHAEQIGYANLVKAELGVELTKSHTRADWTRRPLPEKQIHYALDDVIYLEEVYLKMSKELSSRGRLEWLEPDFEALGDPLRYDKPAAQMWKRIRAAQNLKGANLAALQALAKWRELQARESNKPRTWIIKDDVLADIARQMPDSMEELGHIRGLATRTQEKQGAKLLEIIAGALTTTPEPLPPNQKKKKLSANDQTLVELLNAAVTAIAAEHDISPTQLASRKTLENCVASGSTDELSGWRHPLIGDQIEGLLNGSLTLGIAGGKVVITPQSAPHGE